MFEFLAILALIPYVLSGIGISILVVLLMIERIRYLTRRTK